MPPIEQYLFLTGPAPISDFLSFVCMMTPDRKSADVAQLTEVWRKANDHFRQLQREEAGYPDNPEVRELPPEMWSLRDQVLADDNFRRAYRFVPTDIALVPLDKLVVYQRSINLDFVSKINGGTTNDLSTEAAFRLAFCLDRHLPTVNMAQNTPNSYTFVSPSDDFRFLEGALLDPTEISGFSPSAGGHASALIVLAVGYSLNILNVLRIENRLILHNGGHRAYMLRAAGMTHAPCAVQHISHLEELSLINVPEVQNNLDKYVTASRPPVLRDYFDPKLTTVLNVALKNRLVHVAFNFEQLEIPAT